MFYNRGCTQAETFVYYFFRVFDSVGHSIESSEVAGTKNHTQKYFGID